MSLLSALQQAKDAAAHAKPFMKLMDALTALDAEVRAAERMVKETDEAAQRKAQLEADLPAVEARHLEYNTAIKAIDDALEAKRRDFNYSLEQQQKAADEALAAKHAEIKAAHDNEIAIAKSKIDAMQKELIDLDEQKTRMEAMRDALRIAVQKAHAAVNE